MVDVGEINKIWGIAGIAAQFLLISTKFRRKLDEFGLWDALTCRPALQCSAASTPRALAWCNGQAASPQRGWHEDTPKSSTFLGFSSINQPENRIPHVWNPPYLCYNISMTGYALRYIFRGLHSMRSPWFVSLALLLVETTYVSRFSFCDCAVSISTCHCHVLPRSSSW